MVSCLFDLVYAFIDKSYILAKKATGKSREEAQKEKKQELQKQLDIVQGQLEKQGSAKKPTKQKG